MAEIEMNELSFGYDKAREVLSDISFQIKEGETVGLIGANGAGKSTLLKLLVGLLPVQKGEVCVAGFSMEKKNLERIREKTGYVFQDSESQLFLSTVYEDVAFGPCNYGYSKEEIDRRVMEALEQVSITDLKDRQIYRTSGGQKKLVALASIFAMQPQIILFDEPSIALDPKNRRRLIQIIHASKATKLIASHDLDLILDTCERTILISAHKIVADGRTEDILTNEGLLLANGLELPLSLARK